MHLYSCSRSSKVTYQGHNTQHLIQCVLCCAVDTVPLSNQTKYDKSLHMSDFRYEYHRLQCLGTTRNNLIFLIPSSSHRFVCMPIPL